MIKVFNWIFVALAGAVILLFFFKIIAVHVSITEKEATSRLISSFDSLINKVSASSQTQNFITLPDKKFTFSCEEPCNYKLGCDSYLSIENSDVEVKFPTQVIITPDKFQTSRLFSFTVPWNVPFHVSDFLILSPAEQKIIINCVSTDVKCRRVFSKIPSYFKDAGIVSDSGAGKVISFSSSSSFSSCSSDVCIGDKEIKIKTSSLTTPYTSFNYFTDEEIIAAIFSPSPEFYGCSMKKAYYKMTSVAKVLDGKRNSLITPSTQLNCRSKLKNINLTPYFTNFTNADNDDLFSSLSSLPVDNNFLRVGSCGALY